MRALRFGISVSLLGMLMDVAAARAQKVFTEKDLPDLLVRMEQQSPAREKLEQQYTSDEYKHDRNIMKSGRVYSDDTYKYENIVVEGLLYSHMVEHNGKPLTGKEAEEEQKKLKQTAADRAAERARLRRSHIAHSWDSPIEHLDLFENHLLRTEVLNGRETVVVESLPKADAHPADENAATSLDWKEITWIDVADAAPARVELQMVRNRKVFQKGSTLSLKLERHVDRTAQGDQPEQALWLPCERHIDTGMKQLWINAHEFTDTTWSNYKKFQSSMRMVDGTMQEVPAETH